MEQTKTNDLQELQMQMNLLHNKLDGQSIINDKQIERIPHMRVRSLKAVSLFWLVLSIVVLLLFDGFYGLYYYSLTHFDQMISYYEEKVIAPMDSLMALPDSPITKEQIEANEMFYQKLEWYKKERMENPERAAEALMAVKDTIYGGWMLVLNIVLSLIVLIVIITQIFNIHVLSHGKIQKNISSMTAQLIKIKKAHIISSCAICLLSALIMPIILVFYENMAFGWKILLVVIPALLGLAELLQLTPLRQLTWISMLDWGRVFYIRQTCDKMIRRME